MQPVVGGETPRDTESKQVTEASPNALQEIYDGLSAFPMMTISNVMVSFNRESIDNDEIMYNPESDRTAQVVFHRNELAFAATSFVHEEDALVVFGGASSTLLL
jgi:hypothetical protein